MICTFLYTFMYFCHEILIRWFAEQFLSCKRCAITQMRLVNTDVEYVKLMQQLVFPFKAQCLLLQKNIFRLDFALFFVQEQRQRQQREFEEQASKQREEERRARERKQEEERRKQELVSTGPTIKQHIYVMLIMGLTSRY